MVLALATVTIGGITISVEAIGAAITAIGTGLVAIGNIAERQNEEKNDKK
ncbi:MAG: hypothetical protein J6X60_13975 [Ruminiclostridium sp.]|nr:hypothetical protein [Ruminiclostridium sp.]